MVTVKSISKTYDIEVDNVFQFIIEELAKLNVDSELVFSHLVIDGQEVYTDHETYINKYGEDIKVVELKMVSVDILTNDILSSLNRYLERAVPTLETMISKEFGDMNEKFWSNIIDLTDGMQAIIQFSSSLKTLNSVIYHVIEQDIKSLESILPQLLTALESMDSTLSFDILSFEIVPIFESLQTKVSELSSHKKGDSIEH